MINIPVPIKFKLISTEPDAGRTKVTWVVGFSTDGKTSTGSGVVTLSENLSGMSEDEILSVALSAQGGMNLIDDLTEIHTPLLTRKVENELFDDWYVAYVFACGKQGKTPDAKDVAKYNMAQGFDVYGVSYSHSIFNLTTGANWSHTFAYSVPSETMLYHAKVQNAVVTEWYKHSPTLTFSSAPVQWLALDVATGGTIEYYVETPKDTPGTFFMDKYDADTRELLTRTEHDYNGNIDLPDGFDSVLTALEFQHREHIFGFAEKSYGKIVEYKFTPK